MATIKPIEGRTIHQIQSGQVIVDLCSVVKELVENSLDAGATSIDVRFKNQGLDSIEVQDNGEGISPQNYETVALKHHTSKLSTYSDLTTLQTFGFRGEALSSLCALSYFTITTCLASDAPKGTRLDFEVSGKLIGTSVVAAQKGTTVTVENIFYNLPVRRRELERNIKRDWNRVVSLLGQYACIQTGVKISVTHQPLKGKKATLFSTKGNPSTRENIVNVFGAKTLSSLLTLGLKLELEPTSEQGQRRSTQEDGETKEIHIAGHISRPAFGEGRQTPDRQMFFVNARPCGLPQVAKAFNEVYKSYNSSQSPFIFANIEMDTHLYDVNVSPDKRTILLHDQTRMLEQLKTSLTALFESQDYTVPISQPPAQKQPSCRQVTLSRPNETLEEDSQISTEITENEDDSEGRSGSTSRNKDTDEERPQREYKAGIRPDADSRDSMNRDGEAVSLISNWLSRKTDERSSRNAVNTKPPFEKVYGPSKEKRRLVEKLAKENNQLHAAAHSTVESESSAGSPLASDNLSIPVADFTKDMAMAESEGQKYGAEADSAQVEREDPIPAIISSARQTISAVVGTARHGMRPLRAPATTATITIGDHTVTSTIGTPHPKRPRIEKATGHLTSQASLPSFRNGLSQRFAAPSIDQRCEASDVNMSEEQGRTESPLSIEESSLSMESAQDLNTEDGKGEQTLEVEAHAEDLSLLTPYEELDGDYIDEDEKKAQEEAKVLEMIKVAEAEAARPSDDNAKRANYLLKGGAKRKDATVHFVRALETTVEKIDTRVCSLRQALSACEAAKEVGDVAEEALGLETAEEKLSLTINKSDFASMKIIGQFNLGFILASRTAPGGAEPDALTATDDLFIIDQHASDEKYNFERLQATTIVQSQRLVRPKTLDLTAVEEEIVMENLTALETNGFIVTIDESGNAPVGQRCQLVSLPLSRETTFSLSDLEELLSLLSEHPSGSVPRPSKVRKMFAMRACRSSIMIGGTLTHKQMEKVVKHMGEIDKPWNCPHGRPTMRHLCNLGAWDEVGWKEGDGTDGEEGGATDWAAYITKKRGREA